ncbi:hypothetical protein [Oerskovia rustica]|uniref:Uncharacterized protein n=1 Tax=Oerskovia rustica TaxID=2762237 RepID=A0ABR8RN86_9CELL|nr:hypothetical protein [Oerskovia rustica]MBD7949235.1 hypothetical protein [Oerskovia rustica]
MTDTTFNPATSIPEASARMFALTTSQDSGTRGPKRSLVALAQSIGLDVDLSAVNATLGGQIAAALSVDWVAEHDYIGLQVTLAGMNTLLRAASYSLAALSRSSNVGSKTTAQQVMKAFPGFRPAESKQQAVDRICDIAGVPHDLLGPGGKEHTWTLKDLARRHAPHLLDQRRTKHDLAAALCNEFGVPWLDSAGSTGASITLEGLNLILAGAERHAHVSSAAWATAADEGTALVDALQRGLPDHWDGRACVEWMRESGSTQWRQMEWAGFYFEEKVREILNELRPTPPVGGPKVRFGNTIFDYASPTRVWDAKAHTAMTAAHPSDGHPPKRSNGAMWLNDSRAVKQCIAEQGLGFLVVDGLAGLDASGGFREWHKAYGESDGRPLSGYVASTGTSRPRKAVWKPLMLRAIWIEDLPALDAGIAAGWIVQKEQPDWGSGDARRRRNDKFQGKPHLAAPWHVASHVWPNQTFK